MHLFGLPRKISCTKETIIECLLNLTIKKVKDHKFAKGLDAEDTFDIMTEWFVAQADQVLERNGCETVWL